MMDLRDVQMVLIPAPQLRLRDRVDDFRERPRRRVCCKIALASVNSLG